MAEARQAPAGLTPEALGRVVFPEGPVLSPDGSRLVFVRHRPRRDGSSAPEAVLVDGLDGGRVTTRVLRRGVRLARWSPDGCRLALVGRAPGGDRLSVLDMVDGDVRDVGPRLSSVAGIAWSPDGRRIVVGGVLVAGAAASTSLPGALVIDVESGAETWHVAAGEIADATWSPDGGRLAFRVRHPEGYVAWLVIVAAGGASHPSPVVVGGPGSRILAAAWVPDGASLVMVGSPDFTLHPGVHRADAVTGHLEPLIDEPAPSITDVGGWLDATRLVVHGRERARSGLYVLETTLARLERVLDLDGRAWGLTVDGVGRRFATVRDTATETPAVIVGDLVAGTWRRVSGGARPTPGGLGAEAGPETATVMSAGAAIDTWTLPARGRRLRGPGPAILMVHGGPHDDAGDGWEAGIEQLLADAGFVVAWSNPRGSTSYGRAFTDAVIGDIGRPEVEDLLAVTDALAARSDVDPARIGICGYSHGAYLTAVAITGSRRFAAAVCWSPFTDLLTEWGMSDEGRGWGRWLIGGDPTTDATPYRERSPAWHVEPGVAPTLLIHGERDERCPIGQSVLFQRSLEAVGTPTRLVRLPDADHDLFATPALITTVAKETVSWFATHLRPDEAAA